MKKIVLYCMICIMGIIACYFVDGQERTSYKHAVQINKQLLKKETGFSQTNQKKNVDSSLQKTNAKEEKKTEQQKGDKNAISADQTEDIKVKIVTGTKGSLQKGGSEPIYEYPIDNSAKMASLQYNCCVLLKQEEVAPGWNWVWVNQKEKGYVHQQGSKIKTLTIGILDKKRDAIIKDAYSFLGIPFKRYGTSLTTGIDCSNYVSQIYERNGYQIPNVPNDMKAQGRKVTEEKALPGDIVYYHANNGYGHVGIYIGKDEDGEKYVINTAGHSGRIYPMGGCRINRLQYADRTKYEFYSFLGS